MSPYRLAILFIFSLSCCIISSIQAQFIDVSDQLGEPIYTTSGTVNGNGLSFYDFDKDGWDDLTISRGSTPPLFFKNQGGSFVPASFEIPYTGIGNIMMLLWADYDNDGDEDLLITKRAGPIELWNNDGAFNFTNVAAEAGFFPGNYDHDGAAFADYNHDGCLDVFIAKIYHCSYNSGEQYENKLYLSNCDGTFADVTIDAGVYLCPLTTFQPVFLDFNKDGWEDLYLINDLPEFPNNLFKNNGDGTFTDVSNSTGLDIAIDAMTGTIGDFNNDLLLDIFVTNRPNSGGNYLMVNQGNETYVNQAPELGFGLNYQSWGAVWLDENNDSWEDLFVSIPVLGPPGVFGNEFYINNQGVNFSEGRNQLGFENDFSRTYVCAKGDINNDGYFDLALNNFFTTPFKIYQNTIGVNNYLSLSLEGTISNRNGIGTWIKCFAGGSQWVRHTLCGENLISQNSGKQIFGLGSIEIVDSLVVEWNRGTREVYYNLPVDQHLHLIEGASLIEPIEISYAGDLFLCEGDSLVLDAGIFQSYQWNTGETARFLTIENPGEYWVTVENSFGFEIESNFVLVQMAPTNDIQIQISDVSCFGAIDGQVEVNFSNSPAQSFVWNTGDTLLQLSNLESDFYSFMGIDSFGCVFIGNALVEEPAPITAQLDIWNPSCFGDDDGGISASIYGGTAPYNMEVPGFFPDELPAGVFTVLITDYNDCDFQSEFEIVNPEELSVNLSLIHVNESGESGTAILDVSGGTGSYSILWSTGEVGVLEISNLSAGNYWVLVTDENDCAAQLNFVIENITAVENEEWLELKVFPNPFVETLNITNCGSGLLSFTVFDSHGRLIKNYLKQACNQPIDFSFLTPGVYQLKILSDQTQTIRVVKIP